ncbi:SIR2 family protein [Flavobacteriaceae bacterium F89]|uniref:NAD(+) hydrolase ThsA n=1 Tax=Cerina litoralis TaxID=2874477 RepID=A0AAE3EZ68_9FLAO|nr:SIR2 family protein [Cerina litoralis]MCG2462386.1 SIR2 family protein [Cerina litoralis]
MKTDRAIESFIKEFVKDLAENNVAVFAGAGMSKSAGYVNWADLLRDIATELGLSVDKEHDLISIAQYHVNENRGKARINKKILEEFAQEAETTENHKIFARLPVTTFWTTNYDTLIEDSLKLANKVVDIKHQVKQLANTRPKRDVVVYKMHGDVHHPADAVLTKEQYESYYKTHEAFVTALSGDLISKTFLFVGFSFTDPNLDYVLSRLNIQFGENSRQHYCFIKKQSQGKDDEEMFKYNLRKQELMINDLMRYKIKTILVEEYSDVTEILVEIERRFRKKTVFISGSAEEYGAWNRNEAQSFIHSLSKSIVSSGFRIVNGFGWGVGSAVINGALEAVYERPERYSEDQLIMRPFPQFETGEKKLPDLWEEYRQRMISLAGIAVFIFGNKNDGKGNIISANGVKREFEIAISQGLIPIPIAATGYIAQEIFDEIFKAPEKYYDRMEWTIPIIKELASEKLSVEEIIQKVIAIIQTINK